jgi:hypothetical protein
MLLGQFLVFAVTVVKRFDAVALHTWESAREMARALRGVGSDGETDLG